MGGLQIPRWLGSDPLSAWWLGLAPATLEFWFPNERNQGKQAHPVLKYRVPHGSHAVINTHARPESIHLAITNDRCNYLLDLIKEVYTACTNSTADKNMIVAGLETTTDYPNVEKEDKDLLDNLTMVGQKINKTFINNICQSLNFVCQHQVTKSPTPTCRCTEISGQRSKRRPAKRPDAQDDKRNCDQPHVDSDDERPDDGDMRDHLAVTPVPSPAASRPATPTSPSSACGSPPPSHVYGRRVTCDL